MTTKRKGQPKKERKKHSHGIRMYDDDHALAIKEHGSLQKFVDWGVMQMTQNKLTKTIKTTNMNMNDFKGTKWTIQKDAQDGAEYIVTDDTLTFPANIVCAKYGKTPKSNENWQKHKLLIAAAPDLLKACQHALETISDNGYPDGETAGILREAITKALTI